MASHNYFEADFIKHRNGVTSTTSPNVKVANRNIVYPRIPASTTLTDELSDKAKHAFVVDDLKTRSLVSIRYLCDGYR